ncbi:MAG TPA: ADP-forming succinate--CoA ligase subunit beta [Acidiferrobacteraceae bacterium]|nr:ADP-forming succinate--CoA ligase subunit beta [Acidiferrobacteraceae bacterium]
MNLHEYQAKSLFEKYGVAVPRGQVIGASEEAEAALTELEGRAWVLKAQVHAGGRGKAGGVKITSDRSEAIDFVNRLLGSRLVTYQTDNKGQPVNQILVEEPCEIERELYVGLVVDRSLRRITLMCSTEGGVEIEKVAQQSPHKILRATLHPMVGLQPFQCRQLAFGLKLQGEQIKQFGQLLSGLCRLFQEKDLSLLEINPLVVTKSGQLLCLDGKINVDDNALFRHKDLVELRDTSQEDDREIRAKEWDLSYIALDGDIGCMVNGAGLAMATMDLIKLHGGHPANFLDVGGTATKERVAEAFKIILSDENVKGVLVNIFGGIVRCDLIAEGVVGAVGEVGIDVPVVVRLEGNKADVGHDILELSGLNIIVAANLRDAAQKIVSAVGGRQ